MRWASLIVFVFDLALASKVLPQTSRSLKPSNKAGNSAPSQLSWNSYNGVLSLGQARADAEAAKTLHDRQVRARALLVAKAGELKWAEDPDSRNAQPKGTHFHATYQTMQALFGVDDISIGQARIALKSGLRRAWSTLREGQEHPAADRLQKEIVDLYRQNQGKWPAQRPKPSVIPMKMKDGANQVIIDLKPYNPKSGGRPKVLIISDGQDAKTRSIAARMKTIDLLRDTADHRVFVLPSRVVPIRTQKPVPNDIYPRDFEERLIRLLKDTTLIPQGSLIHIHTISYGADTVATLLDRWSNIAEKGLRAHHFLAGVTFEAGPKDSTAMIRGVEQRLRQFSPSVRHGLAKIFSPDLAHLEEWHEWLRSSSASIRPVSKHLQAFLTRTNEDSEPVPLGFIREMRDTVVAWENSLDPAKLTMSSAQRDRTLTLRADASHGQFAYLAGWADWLKMWVSYIEHPAKGRKERVLGLPLSTDDASTVLKSARLGKGQMRRDNSESIGRPRRR